MGGDTRRLREAGPPAGGTTQAPVLPLPRAVPAVSRCERAETHRGTSRFVQLHFGGLSSSFATSDESFVARGCSAVGSASPCQGEGRGFESRHPLEGAVASTQMVEWPSGEATACKAVHTGSIPVSTSKEYFQPARLAQRESASLTRKRSLVQTQYRPPVFHCNCSESFERSPGDRVPASEARRCIEIT